MLVQSNKITGHDTCRFALSPNPAQISEYLRKKHNITAAERREVTDLSEARIPKLRNPSGAPVREDGSFRDPNLHLVHGYTCKFCIERTGSSQVISCHIASSHEEERPRLEFEGRPCTNLRSCKRGLKVLQEDVTGLSNTAGPRSDRLVARKLTTISRTFLSASEADRKS
jgi:hypothetical protein